MSYIDWSKAPKGYPIWIEELDGKTSGDDWHREETDRYVDRSGRFWPKNRERMDFMVYRKPGSQGIEAAEEREKAISEIASLIGSDTFYADAVAIYDAGYRKVTP